MDGSSGMLRSSGMALKKQATLKRWRSKEAKEIVAAVQRASGQVERTASGHEGYRVSRFCHRRLSAQYRPRRSSRYPQHSGHDQEQDRAGGVARPGPDFTRLLNRRASAMS
jgi:hypothetical protein